MIEQGKVIAILPDGLARVEFASTAGCKKCGICKMTGDRVYIDASNELGAEVGEAVEVEIATKNVLWATFLLFILPIIGLVIGYFIGNVLGAFILLGLTFLMVFLYDRLVRSRECSVKITQKIAS